MNITAEIYNTPCYNKCIFMDDIGNIISTMEDKLSIYNCFKTNLETIISLDKEKLRLHFEEILPTDLTLRFKYLSQRLEFEVHYVSFTSFKTIENKPYIIAITNLKTIHIYSEQLLHTCWEELMIIPVNDVIENANELNTELKCIERLFINEKYVIIAISTLSNIIFLCYYFIENKFESVNYENYLEGNNKTISYLQFEEDKSQLIVSYSDYEVHLLSINYDEKNKILSSQLQLKLDFSLYFQPLIYVCDNIYYLLYHSIVKVINNEIITLFDVDCKLIGIKVCDKFIYTMTNDGDIYVLKDDGKTANIIKKVSYKSNYDGTEKFTGFISSTLTQPNKDGLSLITIRTKSKRENTYVFNKYVHHSYISIIPILSLYDDDNRIMNMLKNEIDKIISEDLNNNIFISRQDIIWYLKQLNDNKKTIEIIQYLLSINNLSSLRFGYYISIICEVNVFDINNLILLNILYRFDNYLKLPKDKQLFHSEIIKRMVSISNILEFDDDRIKNMNQLVNQTEQCNIVDKCPYCDVDVPLTQFNNFTCSNSHPLVRCLNSFRILSDYDGLICNICGTEYNNVNDDEIESWLGNVKNGNLLVCVLCGNILKKDI